MPARRSAWLGLAVGLCLLAVGGLTLLATGRAADMGVVPAALAGGEVNPAGRPRPSAPVRLALPRLGVDADVVPVRVDDAGTLGVPDDPDVLGWWHAGPRPGGRRGSVVLDGHVDSASAGVGVFARLRDLRRGDEVVLTDARGDLHRYAVTGRRSYPKSELPAEVFGRDGDERLVLITCGGRFDEASGHYDDNVVVYAVPAG